MGAGKGPGRLYLLATKTCELLVWRLVLPIGNNYNCVYSVIQCGCACGGLCCLYTLDPSVQTDGSSDTLAQDNDLVLLDESCQDLGDIRWVHSVLRVVVDLLV